MRLKSLPETIQTIIEQAGGLGLHGAFAYIGVRKLTYRCPQPVGEYRSGRPSRLSTEDACSFVDFEVGLSCKVNGKPRRSWSLIIAYEPDDTYAVWLVEGHAKRKAETMVLACRREVYCDTLKTRIECAYDEAINEHNGGFIPLG